MKCVYKDFECDWPLSTGDIECVECVHYDKVKGTTSIGDWLKKLLNKIFIK